MRSTHASYAAFLAEDTRRLGPALELGHNLASAGPYWRACWYEVTGEVTVETIADPAAIRADDFRAGVYGPVQVLACVPRSELEDALGPWPALERWRPRTSEHLALILSL